MNNNIFYNKYFEDLIADRLKNKNEKISFAKNRALYAYR